MIISKLLPTFFTQFVLRFYFSSKWVSIGKNCIVNQHNYFEGHNKIFNNTIFINSHLGLGSYLANNCIIRNCKIGRYCSIGENVRIHLGRHPSTTWVSTHPAFFSTKKQAGFSFTNKQLFEEHLYIDNEKKYVVTIGNDVWIGNNVIIMDGVCIGDGAIIAAGSIVTKSVDPYTIVGGIPSKNIKKRFTSYQINKLMEVKWWNWSIDKIKKNTNRFQNIDQFLKIQ